jgi:hypothetical protein
MSIYKKEFSADTTSYEILKREIQHGDTILISRIDKNIKYKLFGEEFFAPNLYVRIIPGLIKYFTKFKYHHSAIACFDTTKEKMMIYEATMGGFSGRTIDSYCNHFENKAEFMVLQKPANVSASNVRLKINQIYGNGYDFISLFIYQLIFQLTKRWFGKKGFSSLNRIYCSEANAFIYDFDEYWKVDPKELFVRLTK